MRSVPALLLTTALSVALALPAQSQEFRTVRVGGETASPLLGGALLALLMFAIGAAGSDTRAAPPAPPPPPDPTPPDPDPVYAPPGGYQGSLRPRYVIGVTPYAGDPRLSAEPGDAGGFEVPEYLAGQFAGPINAATRYAEGAFGAGALVSVFDTGVDPAHPELAASLTNGLSHSYYNGPMEDTTGHGTHVAGIIAALRDGSGMHGVAPEAQIMALRAIDGPESERSGRFYENWEDAMLRSVEAGADVMNNSWTFVDQNGDPLRITGFADRAAAVTFFGSDLIGTMAYSAQQDLVSVYAAGNGNGGESSVAAGLPLLISELRDHWVSVVALGEDGLIADYSSQCGVAMNWCLAAPGTNLISVSAGGGYEFQSGSSMAAAVVSGSLALLKSNFPEITGATALRILKETARDLGETGVDAVYGHGAIDLAAAMSPVGVLNVQMSGVMNERVAPLGGSGIVAPAGVASAFQAALSTSRLSVTDGYDRSFQVPMAAMVGAQSHASPLPDLTRFTMRGASLGGPVESGTYLSRGAPVTGNALAMPDPSRFSGGHAGLIGDRAISFTHMGEIASGLRFGVTGAHGAADGTGLASLSLSADLGSALFTVESGRVSERDGMLGARFHGAFGGVSATTEFLRASADLPLGRSGTLHLNASAGETSASGTGLLRSAHLRSESVGIGLSRVSDRTGSRMSIGLSRPVRVSGGQLGVLVPIGVGAAADGVASSEVRTQSATLGVGAAEAPIDLQFGYEVPLGAARLGVAVSHRAGAPAGQGTSASFGVSFKF